MNKYYLPFIPSAKVDYLLLFKLYQIAQFDSISGLYNKVRYTSIKELAGKVGISPATINRVLSNQAYKDFIEVHKKEKEIVILNNFSAGSASKPFTVLTDREVKLCFSVNEPLFIRYLLYLKYYCGYARNQQQDFTAGQFLRACGYSDNSHSYIAKLSKYNRILQENEVITITHYRDELGHLRNIYRV